MEQKHTFSIIACFGKFSDINGRFSVLNYPHLISPKFEVGDSWVDRPVGQ